MRNRKFIDRKEFQAQLEDACRTSLDANAGLFGPDSVTWRLMRESVGFFGAGRAVLLQVAHPWVAHGIDQHSRTKRDPLGRFRGTFINVFTFLFGSIDQVHRLAGELYLTHAAVHGRVTEDTGGFLAGSRYSANEISAMLWVHATLWETAIKMYEEILGPLDAETKEAYYQEIKRFAYCFGVPESEQPKTWRDFLAYNQQMWDSDELAVRKVGREVAGFLFDFDLFPGSRLALHQIRLITAEMMPPRLRTEFGLGEPTAYTRANYAAAVAAARAVYPHLPAHIRFLPPYFEALDRLAGKPHSGKVTQTLNRVWIGRPELVSAAV